MSRRLPLLAGAAAVAAGAAVVAARVERRWQAADDPCGPDVLALPEGKAVEVKTDDGSVLSTVVIGPADGDTVVLSHCWTGSHRVWAPVARRLLDRGLRVVLYDQRGHGESTVGTDGCTIERLGVDLRDVLETVGVRDAVVVGHSMGGMTVQAFAAQHPDALARHVRAIVLVATAAGGLGVRGAAPLAGAAIASPLVERMMTSPRGHWLVRRTVGKGPRRAQLAATRDLFVATAPDVRRDFLLAMLAMDLQAGLAGIDVPTTVVIGTRDRLTPPRLGRRLAAALPNSRLVELAGRGHMLPFEAPDDVADAIAEAAARK